MTSKKQPIRAYAVKPTIDELIVSRERMNRASAEFLKLDIQTALTFLTIARQTQDDTRQQRNLRSARKAYDTVLRLMDRVILSDEDARIVKSGLERLRSELSGLGMTI